MQSKALWYVGPGRAELREETIAAPKPGEVQVRSLFGAVSRGTERLIHAGRVPASEYDRMRGPLMAGTFPFPVKYGYATVGRVEAGAAGLRSRIVFSLHPHQSLFILPAEAVFPVPEHVPPRRAVLTANMETALNAVWDGAPASADRIAVVGVLDRVPKGALAVVVVVQDRQGTGKTPVFKQFDSGHERRPAWGRFRASRWAAPGVAFPQGEQRREPHSKGLL